jgi:hypothetical protein
MKFLRTLLLLGGYTLVYAGVANGGVFVYYPWMGVFRDAYGVDSAGTGSSNAGAAPVAPAAGTRGNSEPNDKQVPSPRHPRTRTVPSVGQRL